MARRAITAWTDDASSGISDIRTKWGYHFNSVGSTSINQVDVTGVTGNSPSVNDRFAVLGFAMGFAGDGNALTGGSGGSAAIASNFLYGADPGAVVFEGLTPGQAYRATFLSVGWDDPPVTRVITLGSPTDSLTIDQNAYGNNEGIRFDHFFTPDSTSHAVVLKPATNSTFHLYALALSHQASGSVADWKQAAFGADASNPLISGENEDPEKDGGANLLEYAFRTEPLIPNPPVFRLPATVQLPGSVDARQFSFPYQATSADLRYRLQYSSDLGMWNDAFELNLATHAKTQIPGVSGIADANAQSVTVDVTDPTLFGGTIFWRLVVDLP